ncbi:hypothetical protein VRZ08_04950 [Rhodopseudomonas sp. G2_2311]|jgi:hypothetical protein|uniref:hypothetical protein n=1 Tax=Rhodopseudomonas sp. G2_2311 TaxID=3114287 RepID=UPI0039C70452
MQRRKKAHDGLQAVEARDAERHDGCERRTARIEAQKLEGLRIAEVVEGVCAVLVGQRDLAGRKRAGVSSRS